MNPTGFRKWMPLGLMGVSALSLVVGLAAWKGLLSGSIWVMGAGLGALCGLGAGWFLYLRLCQEQSTLTYLNQLAEKLSRDFLAANAFEERPALRKQDPFWPALQTLSESIGRLQSRLNELDHLRTGLEVRFRRVQNECHQINTILAAITDPLLVINDYGELLWTNPSAEALLRSVEKKTRRAAAEVVECEKLVELLQSMTQRKTAGTRTEEIEWTDPAGKVHHYRALITRLAPSSEHPDPTAVGVVVALRDIGDQKALQKRHAEFVSSVSHEMKTPLAGIKAYVELLADGDVDDPETQQEFLRTITGQVERLQRLVENLLNLARIEAGVVQVHKQAQSLNEILEEAIRVVQPAAETKQIRLETDLSELYLNVYVDRDLMLQAAINLLSNAVKYTPPGGRVTLRSRLEDQYAQFEVEDTGVGLSEEDCQRVFEKFYRVQKDSHMASGTGLGLPLAKHIVEDVHGGVLTVQSKLGEGSTFRVRLPFLARHWEKKEEISSAKDAELATAEAPSQ